MVASGTKRGPHPTPPLPTGSGRLHPLRDLNQGGDLGGTLPEWTTHTEKHAPRAVRVDCRCLPRRAFFLLFLTKQDTNSSLKMTSEVVIEYPITWFDWLTPHVRLREVALIYVD